tara:strand:+ start:8838 stop:9080 length:243 start_codon:yes stop_codon:yes gene_type:complete
VITIVEFWLTPSHRNAAFVEVDEFEMAVSASSVALTVHTSGVPDPAYVPRMNEQFDFVPESHAPPQPDAPQKQTHTSLFV